MSAFAQQQQQQQCTFRTAALEAAVAAEPPALAGAQRRPTLCHLTALAAAAPPVDGPAPARDSTDVSTEEAAALAAREGAAAVEKLLANELWRVRHAGAERAEALWQRLLSIVKALPPKPATAEMPDVATTAIAKELLAKCDDLGADYVALEQFLTECSDAAGEVARSRDGTDDSVRSSIKKGTNAPSVTEMQAVYAAAALECIAGGIDRNAILLGLSDVYEHLHRVVPDPEDAPTPWAATPAGGSPRAGGSIGGSMHGGTPLAGGHPAMGYQGGFQSHPSSRPGSVQGGSPRRGSIGGGSIAGGSPRGFGMPPNALGMPPTALGMPPTALGAPGNGGAGGPEIAPAPVSRANSGALARTASDALASIRSASIRSAAGQLQRTNSRRVLPGGELAPAQPPVVIATTPDGGAAVWVPPDEFQRKSTKFWARPSAIPAIQAEIVRHLPVLVFDRRKDDRITNPGDIRITQTLAQQNSGAAGRLASVYYDNPQHFSTYAGRLAKEDGAQLVRVRWYGARREGPEGAQDRLFVERKTHREKWTGQSSVKERAEMKQHHMVPFVAGRRDLPELEGDKRRAKLLRAVQGALTANQQEPVLRTSCSRVAYQTTDSAALRVSIDTDLRFTKETAAARGPAWCRAEGTLAAAAAAGEQRLFPYAVVELKVEAGANRPQWVENLLAAGVLLEVPAFSKFLHATALLYPSQVVEAPSWFLPDGRRGNSVSPATYEELEESTADEGNTPWGNGATMRAPSLSRMTRTERLLSFMRGSAVQRPRAANQGAHKPTLDTISGRDDSAGENGAPRRDSHTSSDGSDGSERINRRTVGRGNPPTEAALDAMEAGTAGQGGDGDSKKFNWRQDKRFRWLVKGSKRGGTSETGSKVAARRKKVRMLLRMCDALLCFYCICPHSGHGSRDKFCVWAWSSFHCVLRGNWGGSVQ